MKIILTNLPAFYKINLYNALAKNTKIFVVFTGLDGETRNEDFAKGKMNFPYVLLKGNQLQKMLSFYKMVKKQNYSEIILSSWETFIPWLVALTSPSKKNAVVVESSIKESNVNGIKGFIKRIFFKRCSKAYVSGKSQGDLALALNPKIRCVKTRGVGVFNYRKQPPFEKRTIVRNFIYVGRLIREKNLEWLIEQFNRHPELHLDIIGFGMLEEQLKKLANDNINFVGPVDNIQLFKYYQDSDVFILPSISEAWGLVVEEALNNGLPVMVSEFVGCADEIVNEDNGVVFSLNEDDFESKLKQICNMENYNQMRLNISKMDFERIEVEQINCYLK